MAGTASPPVVASPTIGRGRVTAEIGRGPIRDALLSSALRTFPEGTSAVFMCPVLGCGDEWFPSRAERGVSADAR